MSFSFVYGHLVPNHQTLEQIFYEMLCALELQDSHHILESRQLSTFCTGAQQPGGVCSDSPRGTSTQASKLLTFQDCFLTIGSRFVVT